MRESQDMLSDAGQSRREQILQAALREAGTRRRRRHVRSAVVIAAVPLIAIGILAVMRHAQIEPSVSPPLAMPITAGQSAPKLQTVTDRPMKTIASDGRAVIKVFGDDPTLIARAKAVSVVSQIKRIDDDQLIRTLDQSGLQAGLATIGHTTHLYIDGQPLR